MGVMGVIGVHLHTLPSLPSSHTFWLVAYSVSISADDTHRWWSPIFDLMRSAGPGRCLMLVLLVLFTSVLTGRDVNNKMCTFYFFTLIMQACNLPFMHALELSYADLNLQPRPSACWTAQLLSAFQELRGSELYVRAVQTGRAILMQELTADLKHRMRGVWRDLDAELVDPNTHNNKLATYHSWFAIPLEMSVCRLMYHGISILICPNMLCAI